MIGTEHDIKDLEESNTDGETVVGTLDGKRVLGEYISDDRIKIVAWAESVIQ